MNINTKAPFGAIAISIVIIVSFSIGVSAGKKMTARQAPVDQVKTLECVDSKNIKKI